MTVDDLLAFYSVRNIPELAKKSSFKMNTLYFWNKNGIPENEQALLQLRTNGILKAEIKQPPIEPINLQKAS